ncbi:hypothetical protein CGLAMM_07320 [Acetobacteraceae bacterium EV16G]|uniref:Uncharacterized protein n=1 Tax=Sorlinia euscelidii TaxID=3081148 RepID=A0ABU7U4H5_9PROT
MPKTERSRSSSRPPSAAQRPFDAPTPERLQKSDFTRGHPRRVVTMLDALLKTGDISDDAYSAASRWRRDYLFARFGYQDFDRRDQQSAHVKHDEISWRMTQAEVWCHLAEIRDAIGSDAHRRLEWGLIDELTFVQMAARIMPQRTKDDARKRVSAQFAMTLTRLDEVYKERQRAKQRDRQLSIGRELTPARP